MKGEISTISRLATGYGSACDDSSYNAAAPHKATSKKKEKEKQREREGKGGKALLQEYLYTILYLSFYHFCFCVLKKLLTGVPLVSEQRAFCL